MTPLSPLTLVLVGWAVMAGMMLTLWIVQRIRNDAGIVDVGWAAGLGILGLIYAVASDGDPTRRALVGAMAAIWSFRLAYYLLFDRVIGKTEDGRYQTIRKNWASNLQVFFFLFFQAQGLLDVILSISFIVPIANAARPFGALDIIGAAIWIVAVVGESIADRQLARFRANPDNRGKVCREGLWRYSRHPNYFFEWLHWWAYVPIAIGSSWWWLTLISPAIMLFLILKVTGIPPTEAQALQSRGDAYRQYQRETSALIPWFPKRAAT